MSDAVIHLRVPAATKGRWVRESRSRGQRLTDWIVERVERGQLPETAMSNPYEQNRDLAGRLLEWSRADQIGVSNDTLDMATELAINMLRPLAESLQPGHVESAWTLYLTLPEGDESDQHLITAAAWGRPGAVEAADSRPDLANRIAYLRGQIQSGE